MCKVHSLERKKGKGKIEESIIKQSNVQIMYKSFPFSIFTNENLMKIPMKSRT